MMDVPADDITCTLFPPTSAVNINHLGLSTKTRYDRKTKLIKLLVRRNIVVNVRELHVSAARAQDAFFDNFPTHHVLDNLENDLPDS